MEATAHGIFAHLLLLAANDREDLYGKSAMVYSRYAKAEMQKIEQAIHDITPKMIKEYQAVTPVLDIE